MTSDLLRLDDVSIEIEKRKVAERPGRRVTLWIEFSVIRSPWLRFKVCMSMGGRFTFTLVNGNCCKQNIGCCIPRLDFRLRSFEIFYTRDDYASHQFQYHDKKNKKTCIWEGECVKEQARAQDQV